MRIHGFVGVVCALTVFVTASCGVECTEVGCDSSILVAIEGADSPALPESTYDIVLEIEDSAYPTTCQITDGMNSCELVEGPELLDVEAYVTASGSIEVRATTGDAVLDVDTAQLRVTVGGSLVVDEAWELERNVFFPNGESCGPRCETVLEEFAVTLDAP